MQCMCNKFAADQVESDPQVAARGEGHSCWASGNIAAPGGGTEPCRAQTRGERTHTHEQSRSYRKRTSVSCFLMCNIDRYLRFSRINILICSRFVQNK